VGPGTAKPAELKGSFWRRREQTSLKIYSQADAPRPCGGQFSLSCWALFWWPPGAYPVRSSFPGSSVIQTSWTPYLFPSPSSLHFAATTVCDSGCSYTTIAEAVESVTDAELISVSAGTYNERHVDSQFSFTLQYVAVMSVGGLPTSFSLSSPRSPAPFVLSQQDIWRCYSDLHRPPNGSSLDHLPEAERPLYR
jgi:hypothetical protein